MSENDRTKKEVSYTDKNDRNERHESNKEKKEIITPYQEESIKIIDVSKENGGFHKENINNDMDEGEDNNEGYSSQKIGNANIEEEGYSSSNHKENLYYPNYSIPQNLPPQNYYNPPLPHGPHFPNYIPPSLPHGPHFPNYPNFYPMPQDPHHLYPLPPLIPHGQIYSNLLPEIHGPHYPHIQFTPLNQPFSPHGVQIPLPGVSQALPPHFQSFPPYKESIPYELSIRPHGYLPYPPHGAPPYPPHGSPPFPPHGVPPYPPHDVPPFPPHSFPPYSPHGSPPFPPHEFPPYSPHGALPFPPHGSPHFPPHGSPLHGFPPYSPHDFPPFPPHEFPPYPPHGVPPFPPHSFPPGPPHGSPPFPPHGAPPYPPHGVPPFPPHGTPPYTPHGAPPFSPHSFPPYPPHGLSPYPPHGIPPYTPHGTLPFPPHGIPSYPSYGIPHEPQYSPHYGPHFIPPQPYKNQYHNREEDEKDVGFSSNNGQINIYDNNQSNKYNTDNVKDDYYNYYYGYNEDMQYNSYDYYMDYGPNDYRPYLMDQYYYNYYGNEQINWPDNYVYFGQENIINPFEENKSSKNKEILTINYDRVPLYIDIHLSEFLMNENNPCFPKIRPENIKFTLPIVIIQNPDFYSLFLNFIKTNSIYKEFNSFPILKNKLILNRDDLDFELEESHFPKNFNIIKFADITDSFEFPLYKKEETENIINEIKKTLNEDENYFIKFMNSWINIVMDLIVEFIKFKLQKISYFYYCNTCHFPCFYISDYIDEEFFVDENIDKLMIGDSINAFNELIEIVHIQNGEKKRENIINVICYEEEYNYMNYSFENEINGIFINCNNIKSFNKIMNEINDRNIFIQNKNSKISSKIKFNITNNYMFELIISAIYVDKIFQYLINNSFFRLIKGICILIDHKNGNNSTNVNNSLLAIKKKYIEYLKDIHVEQNDVFQFLKNAKAELKYRNNKKYSINNPIINYINYSLKHLNLHKNISFYYNKYPNNSFIILKNILYDFLKTIDIIKNQPIGSKITNKEKNNKKKIPIKNQTLSNIQNIFQEIKENLTSDKENKFKKNYEINLIINNNIDKYEQNLSLFNTDFNLWINSSDNLNLEKISYFIGSLMYTLDTDLYDNGINYEESKENNKNNEKNNINPINGGDDYNENNNINQINGGDDYNANNNNVVQEYNEIVLYKEFIGNYVDVMIHENNKFKIITFPGFLVCSTEQETISKNDDDKYNILYIIKYDLTNSYNYVQILFDLDDNTKVFQMFTFFRITDIKTKRNPNKVMVYLEPINKKEYLELKLRIDDTIIYNYNLNIMETIRYDTSIKYDDKQENINQNNLYITASEQLYDNNNNGDENNRPIITEYMNLFNNKYGTNLNSEMTSLSLEESNMKNMGLLLLSKTNLENLIVLNLNKNNISDISPFKYCNFPKLKKLTIESDKMANPEDKITDISPLMHSNFPELFILNLKNNLINDISYLLFMNFPNLIILDLSHNQIESVYVFSEVNFPNLETLDLCNNLISDISPLISSGKKKQALKSIENSTALNSSSVSNFLSKSISNTEMMKKNSILPSLKILKIKNNKILIDEGFLMTIKALKNRGITIFK